MLNLFYICISSFAFDEPVALSNKLESSVDVIKVSATVRPTR